MEISVRWFDQQFNVALASQPGKDAFLEIKGCRIANGKNGPFVSWPSTKNQSTGKYWNHIYGSEQFNAVVLSKAQECMPTRQDRQRDDDSGPPF